MIILSFLTAISVCDAQKILNARNDGNLNQKKYALEDFSIDLNALLSPPNHLWVMSGWSTVNPVQNTVMGTGECYGPPFAGRDFRLSMKIIANGHEVRDAGSTGKGDVGLLYSGGVWRPDRIIRNGTYHFIVNEKLISFSVRSELVPLYNRTGFLLKITTRNRTTGNLKIDVIPAVNPGKPSFIQLNNWTFGQPVAGNEAKPEGINHWTNGITDLDLIEENTERQLAPDESFITYIAVVFREKGNDLKYPDSLREWETETEKAWKNRLSWALKNIPVIKSNVPGLDDYYKRSVVSGLVCIWENPSFAVNPFLSTLGIDGGGICSYLWDFGGYTSEMSILLLGDQVIKNAKAMTAIDLTKYYAYTLDGSGIGVPYSFSTWSYVYLVWSIWRHSGPELELLKEAVRLVTENEKYKSGNNLIDFGVQKNLLEMRSSGWEHFVASPNAERAWCLERLAKMGKAAGYQNDLTESWRSSAAEIRYAIQNTLWDKEAGWFKSIYPDGHSEIIYSIQAYDAMRAGVCTPEMEDELSSHLKDGYFLFPYGVSSISGEDSVHYEVNDPDWSGGGAYTGEGPILALTMYEKKKPELAMNILQRLFWMGRHLPYYPQEHFAGRPAVPANKRANEISGMTGAQTIIYGMAGFDPRIDGSLWINPQFPEGAHINLAGYGWKQNLIDLSLNNNTFTILLNGKKIYSGKQKMIRIL